MTVITQIESINFPAKQPGSLITGTVAVKNIGDMVASAEGGQLSLLITTLWDGKEHPQFQYSSTKPGETLTFSYHMGIGAMPEENAVIEVVSMTWLGHEEGYRTDDARTVNLEEALPSAGLEGLGLLILLRLILGGT